MSDQTSSPDLAELFARDPLSLTNSDIDVMIHHYREARTRYLSGEKSAGKPPAKPKAEKKTVTNISLEDLGL